MSQRDVISAMAKYIATTQSVSVKQMVRYAAQAGYIELVDEPEEADVILSADNVEMKDGAKRINPNDVNSLVSFFL